MKHIQSYNIFENNQVEPQHPRFPETEEEIHRLCKKYRIKNYTINNDLSIDVDGNVFFNKKSLIYLPLNFNYVSGYFTCTTNILISLEGSPKEIGDGFYCNHNELTTLKGGPEKVNKEFNVIMNNLMTLDNLPSGIDYNNPYTDFQYNPIYSIIYEFIKLKNAETLVKEFNDYSIVRDNTIILNRLKAFISDFDLEMPVLDEINRHYKIV